MNELNEASAIDAKIDRLKALLPHDVYVQRYDDVIAYLAKYLPLTVFGEFEGKLNNTLMSDEDVDFTLKMFLKKAPAEFDPEIDLFYASRSRQVPSVMMYSSFVTPDNNQAMFVDCIILYDKGQWQVLSNIDIKVDTNFFDIHKNAFSTQPKPGKTSVEISQSFKTPVEALRFITPIWDDLVKLIKDRNLKKV